MMFDVCLFIHRTGLLLEAPGVGTYGILYINSNTKYKTESKELRRSVYILELKTCF